MAKRPSLGVVAVALLAAAGCERDPQAFPASRSTRSAADLANVNAVAIRSIDPSPRHALRVGDTVRFRTEVTYNVNVETATVSMVVQAEESLATSQASRTVGFGNGSVVLEAEYTVPKTHSVQVFVPLHVPGSGSSVVIDHRAYRVVAK